MDQSLSQRVAFFVLLFSRMDLKTFGRRTAEPAVFSFCVSAWFGKAKVS